ncbi:hypothetical protein G7039_14055 [Rhizobium leguminosarum]|nr:hypothetical protein G7039_14055 [Rhizobium leguminosarum]
MPPAAAGPIRSTITGPRRRRSTRGDAVDTLSVSSLDGTASHNIVVAITGANDAASIVVDATVTDDRATVEAGAAGSGDPNASGKLTVSDVDDGEAAFAAPASLNGIYGSFTFNAASGSWTYTLDNNRAATQALNRSDAVSDTLSVSSLDGTASHNIVVAITGANDAASIVVDATVTDDRATVEAGAAGSGDPNASGKLTVSDVDDGEAAFAAPGLLNGIYGSFTFNAASGSWTYTLDNNRAATQALNEGDAVSDTLSVSSLDGTASHNIVVAITGANDAASIVVDATVTDDRATVEAGAAGSGDPNASGKLTVSDVDDGEAAFAAPASLNGIYGSFTFNAASGSWTYTLDNNRAATQALNRGRRRQRHAERQLARRHGQPQHRRRHHRRQRCGFDRRRCDGHRRSGDGRGGCGRQRRSECLRQADGQRCRRRRGGVCRPGLPQRHLWQLHLQCRQRQLDLYARQ